MHTRINAHLSLLSFPPPSSSSRSPPSSLPFVVECEDNACRRRLPTHPHTRATNHTTLSHPRPRSRLTPLTSTPSVTISQRWITTGTTPSSTTSSSRPRATPGSAQTRTTSPPESHSESSTPTPRQDSPSTESFPMRTWHSSRSRPPWSG